MKKRYFSPFEIALWTSSAVIILASFFIFEGGDVLSLISSLVGITSLIFAAKGNPIGPLLMVIFSVIYGIISFSFAYYGEMVTYLGMTLPMSVIALVAWLKNPYKGKKSEVTVAKITKKEVAFAALLTAAVTIAFYFILKVLGNANLVPSTLSVATSFAAVYLTYRRSPYYAVCYAANDIVLIVLWTLASLTDTSYISVVVCFAVFLINDIYGFINWRKMAKNQSDTSLL